MVLSDRIQSLLSHPRLPTFAALAAVLLCAPSLWLGFQWDDHYLRLVLMRPPLAPEWSRTPLTLFSFYTGDESFNRAAMSAGTAPWWTHPELRLAFFRPLTGLTHWVDFRLWAEHPWVMHVHSLLWFGAAIAAAAALYRRLLLPVWVAGLAIVLFALDNAHGLPAVWIANRNACVAVLFGFLALIAHDKWRRDGWRPGRALAPLALLLGLLGGEMALATIAYLLAYALFLDKDNWRIRVGSLIPSALICVVWWFGYRLLGYGASGSAMYIDPGLRPYEFVIATIQRLPLLFFGQWALPSESFVLLSEWATQLMWLMAVGLMLVMALLLWPLLRREKLARFFALGMMLSLLPACATLPGDRLLFLAGFGGMGLLAQFVAAVRGRAYWLPGFIGWRLAAGVAVWVLLINHLIFAPMLLVRASSQMRIFSNVIERAGLSLPSDPAVSGQQFLIVNTPSTFISGYGGLVKVLSGEPAPRRMLTLGSSIHPTRVHRPEENGLIIHPQGGYMAPRGRPLLDEEGTPAAFDMRYLLPVFDPLYRDRTPFRNGEKIELGGVIVEVTAVTADGRPEAVHFHFDRSLDDPSLRWLKWDDGEFVGFAVPPVGGSVTLPAATVPGLR